MTFESELFPTTKDNSCSKNAGLSYYSPRMYDLKRVYPWSKDVSRPGISSNKKQAVEAAPNGPYFKQWSVSPLVKASNYPLIPVQIRGEHVLRPSQFLYMANSSLGASNTSARSRDFSKACQGDASVHSHNPHEFLKVKANEAHDSESTVSAPIRDFFRGADDGKLVRTAAFNKYYGSFLSLGCPSQIKDGNHKPTDVIHNEELDLRLTLGRNYEENTVSGRADEEPKHESGVAIADNRVTVNNTNYAHLSGAASQTNPIQLNVHQNNINLYVIHNYRCNVHRTLGYNYKQKGNIDVFGRFKVTANNETRVDNQTSAHSLGPTSRVGTFEPNSHPCQGINSNLAGYANKQYAFRREKPKTISEPHPNAVLSSIHNLLSTGLFNGAPVKYILRRRAITLCGVIKGPKILCSCTECNNSEYVSPYKFEIHAGGRTKHPNTCIYLENGKTIYDVFHELRDTPRDMLFDAIPKIAGSAVSRLHFHLLKASYSAAVLTLQQNNEKGPSSIS